LHSIYIMSINMIDAMWVHCMERPDLGKDGAGG
jgi:hypothetical protein